MLIVSVRHPVFDDRYLTFIKNPTKDEYYAFKDLTKYKTIRGVVVDDNVYITDAEIGIHEHLYKALNTYLRKEVSINDKNSIVFEDDKYNHFSIRGDKTSKNLKIIFENRLENATVYKSLDDNSFYRLESEYCNKNNTIDFATYLKENNY